MPAVRPEQWGGGGDSRRMGGGVPSARTSAGDRGSMQTGNRASFTGEGSRDDMAGSRATTGDAVGPRDRRRGAITVPRPEARGALSPWNSRAGDGAFAAPALGECPVGTATFFP